MVPFCALESQRPPGRNYKYLTMAKKSKKQVKKAVVGASSPDLRLFQKMRLFASFLGLRLKMRLFASFQKFRLFVSISKGFFLTALRD